MDNLTQIIQSNGLLVSIIVLWSVAWKGAALWHAARGKQTAWYIVLLLVNTLGILEIIYLAFFRNTTNKTI